MIQIKYIPLFEISFLHDFYTDKTCRDIMVIPTAECAIQLQKTGLRFLASETGCRIFARVNETGGKNILQLPLTENFRLAFLLILRNKNFKTFTQLDLNAEKGRYYYFNNLEENNDTGGVVHLVSDKAGKKPGSGDLKKFKSGVFKFISDTAVAETDVRIRFTDTGEQLQQLLDKENGNNRKNFSFDLGVVSAGRAELLVQAVSKDSFYVMNAADRQDIFGLIEIFHRASLPEKNKFVNETDNSISAKKFIVHFANRQTTWRYNVNRKFNADITGITIRKENGSVIEFETAAGSTQDLFIKTSKTPIPLTEAPVTGIKLTDNNNNEVIAHLPNASLQVLKEEGGKHFSDIFITI
jgi:hypothetical protein